MRRPGGSSFKIRRARTYTERPLRLILAHQLFQSHGKGFQVGLLNGQSRQQPDDHVLSQVADKAAGNELLPHFLAGEGEHNADKKAAATVSPAPDTSKTSCAEAGLFQTRPSLLMTVMPFSERVTMR